MGAPSPWLLPYTWLGCLPYHFEGVQVGIFGFPPAAPCFLLGLIRALLLEGLFEISDSYK